MPIKIIKLNGEEYISKAEIDKELLKIKSVVMDLICILSDKIINENLAKRLINTL